MYGLRLLLLPLLTLIFVPSALALPGRTIVPWMCLERCGMTPAESDAQISVLLRHALAVQLVSFERYNLGPNSTVVVNNLTQVSSKLKAAGFKIVPMVSTYPYPPDTLANMRHVFAHPEPFIQSLGQHLLADGADGVNIDCEPTTPATAEDAQNYAAFVLRLRRELSQLGLFVSVDVGRWSNLWNFTLLASAVSNETAAAGSGPSVVPGYIATMNTYAMGDSEFEMELQYTLNHVPLTNLIVGLDTWPLNLTAANVSRRFHAMSRAGVTRVGIWRVPVPDFWWPFIDAFIV